MAARPRLHLPEGANGDFPKKRGTSTLHLQEVGDYQYVLEQGAKNLRASAKYATDVTGELSDTIQELIQVKEAISMSRIRTSTYQLKKDVDLAKRIALTETEAMLTEKVNNNDQALIHLLEAQARINMCAYVQPILPNKREYLKYQLDERSLIIRPALDENDPTTWKYRVWEDMPNNLPWDPEDPETWKNYGWIENNLPWDPEDEETWKNYGWRDFSKLKPMDPNDPTTWGPYGWIFYDDVATNPGTLEQKMVERPTKHTLATIEEVEVHQNPTDSPSHIPPLEEFFPPRGKKNEDVHHSAASFTDTGASSSTD